MPGLADDNVVSLEVKAADRKVDAYWLFTAAKGQAPSCAFISNKGLTLVTRPATVDPSYTAWACPDCGAPLVLDATPDGWYVCGTYDASTKAAVNGCGVLVQVAYKGAVPATIPAAPIPANDE